MFSSNQNMRTNGYPLDMSAPLFDNKFMWFDHSTFGGKIYEPTTQPNTRTTDPIVTGSSVIGVRYRDGVAITTDTLASYGSLARFRDIRRIHKINSTTIMGASGEYSDFQYIQRFLDELVTENDIADNKSSLSPHSIFSYMTRVMYSRRNKMDPLWNNAVIAGWHNDKAFLGSVDLLGTHYIDDHIATGYGDYIARPLLRNAWRPDLTKEEAVKLLETCMRVLFYRDARTTNRIQIATIGADGVNIGEPVELSTDWSIGKVTLAYDGTKQYVPTEDRNNNNV